MTNSSSVFSLVGKNLKLNSKADIQPYLDELNRTVDLQEIHLGGNTFGVEACQALADVLKTKHTLKVADFADIFTGRLISEIPDALRALCDALIDITGLVELNLSDNAFGGRSAEPMVNFLKNNHSFSVLKLNNNGLGVTGGTIVAEALLEAADIVKAKGLESNLRTVICGRNRLENGSAPVWAKAYAAHGGLVEVRMFQNGIRMEGIEAISKGLASCKNLEVLDLQDNTATIRGSRAIAACLPAWPSLKTLNLSDCLLKPKGGALVFSALSTGSNPRLETIQLQYCDLDRKALAQLGTAIRAHLPSLTRLEINGNWADEDDECIEKIRAALAAHDHEDALDELDEMDPDGEDDDDEGSEDGEAERISDEGSASNLPATKLPATDESDGTVELANALAATHVADTPENRGIVAATSTEAVEHLTRVQPDDQSQTMQSTKETTNTISLPPAGMIQGCPQPLEQLQQEMPKDRLSSAANIEPDPDARSNEPIDQVNEVFAETQSTSQPAATSSTDSKIKKKRGFRVAWDAVRRTLR